MSDSPGPDHRRSDRRAAAPQDGAGHRVPRSGERTRGGAGHQAHGTDKGAKGGGEGGGTPPSQRPDHP
ncbi:hypothetical protein [Streptomyces sp. NPDC088923]|uniref:hypothetical protein n=1 Tax=Streptomyces sp. NPDC088923 TaxID=3365913 RepID=UPI0038123B5F